LKHNSTDAPKHLCIKRGIVKRIVFTNDKGGVGKTTTVANIAVGLSGQGKKTLVIDMDPQADVTFALLGRRAPEAGSGYIPPTIHSLLTGHYPIEQVILSTPRYPNLSLIPSNADLAEAALKLAQRPTRLLRLLNDLQQEQYDLVLIDTGKGLDPLAINAMAAAQEVIVMVTPGRLELDAIARMKEHVELVRDEVLLHAREPLIRGILLTLADPYSITRDTLQRIQDQFPGLLLQTVIPKNNDLQKAIGRAQSIFEIAPESKSAVAYRKLIEELAL
jgi:chromosome partitioning protein